MVENACRPASKWSTHSVFFTLS